jgi:Ca-activated chloride channel family protein
LKTVYSPSHDVSVRRTDDSNATASWEGRSEFPDRDFQLYYATNNDDVGLSLLTYQSGDRDGYFMLVASPRFSIPKERILPKQIVFVLDRTGSMQENNKMEQGKNALKFCLNNLNANDRFDVITFNETPDILTKALVPASTENVEKAQKFVAGVEASGGTNIDEALRAALGLLKNTEGTQKMVVFLTDGLPTVGETNIDTILANVQRMNGSSRLVSTTNDNLKEAAGTRARIFSFGVGYDVNVPFLDRLSEQNRAEADYVRPTENIESIVSAFYSKVTSPILANLSLAFNGAEVYDVYPKELPDLFKGGQLIISGRYRGSPSGGVKLAGYAQNQQATYTLANGFGDSAARSGLVPRIWATRKIGYLLDQVRLHANKEVIDEIVRLSKEYGIITPYTSYLADERTDSLLSEVARPAGGTIPLNAATSYKLDSSAELKAHAEARKDLTDLGLLYQRGDAGAGATARAINSRGYQNAGQAPSGAQGGFGAGGGRGGGGFGLGGSLAEDTSVGKLSRSQVSVRFGDANELAKKNSQNSNRPGYQQVSDVARVQSVGGRTFYKSNKVWFDNNYPSGQKVVKVQALSDAHFQLLKAIPELNKYAAVGDEVVLNLGKISVQFGKEGKEKLTDAELKELTGK